jgi:low temperature requirement protein LtrA
MIRQLVRPTGGEHRVTTLELFFDLVFVFAITQVTAVMAGDLSLRGAVRGLVLVALLWWAWCSYAWLGNQAHADEGVLRVAMVLAMLAMFAMALAIPEAWSDRPGGLLAPLVIAIALGYVRMSHLAVYFVAALGDRGLQRQLLRTALPVGFAAGLLIVGALLGGAAQTGLWLLALAVDYTGIYAVGISGWRLPAPAHFAERHGLIVIIALGESIVAIGIGAAELPLAWPILVAAGLGLAVSVALWWAYFDVVALVAERVLVSRPGAERARLARDSYTYLHFPMIAGIIYLALGLKKTLEQVGDAEQHALSEALPGVAQVALYGGVAVYFLGHIGFRLRNVGSINVPRLVVATGLLALIPVATQLPALGSLALLATLLVGLIAFEVVRYAEARDAIRHSAH